MTTFLKVANRAFSSLNGGISDADLSLTVAVGEGALFPSTYPFHVTIEDEILSCTNRVADVLTVTREAEGTTAAAHADGKRVSLNITAEIISQCQDHEALTTGVHGVGARHVAETSTADLDLAAHKTRHEDGGADEISLTGLAGYPLDAVSIKKMYWLEPWKSIDGWTESHDGGTFTPAMGRSILSSSAVINKRGTIYTTSALVFYYPNYNGLRVVWPVQASGSLLVSEIRMYLVAAGEAVAPLVDTDAHGGFKIINGAIYSSHCDGTNAEVATDLSYDMSAHAANRVLEMRGTGTSIQFYLHSVLAATHDTNLPTGYSYRAVFEITNQEAVAKALYVYTLYNHIN